MNWLKESIKDFPGGTVNENSPANAGDMGLIPDPEDSACHGAIKPLDHSDWSLHTLEPVLCKKRNHHIESLPTTTKRSPHSLQLEKAGMQQQRPSTDKTK